MGDIRDILDYIQYAQDVLERCKEIITDEYEENKINKLYIRVNSVKDISYDILNKIDDLQK